MSKEYKELLIKDLCARLPYNLYVRVEEFNVPKNEAITEGFVGNYLKDNRCNDYDADGLINELADDLIDVKPYLRSMSSMTKEEREEYNHIAPGTVWENEIHIPNINQMDWLNTHHFDYRGFIKKGLAIAVTEENNPYKIKL